MIRRSRLVMLVAGLCVVPAIALVADAASADAGAVTAADPVTNYGQDATHDGDVPGAGIAGPLRELWSVSTEVPADPPPDPSQEPYSQGTYFQPVIVGGSVYETVSHGPTAYLQARSLTDGHLIWQDTEDNGGGQGLSADGDRIFTAGTEDGNLRITAYDATSGAVLWRHEASIDTITGATITAGNGLVAFGGLLGGSGYLNIEALSEADGHQVWLTSDGAPYGSGTGSTVAITGNTVEELTTCGTAASFTLSGTRRWFDYGTCEGGGFGVAVSRSGLDWSGGYVAADQKFEVVRVADGTASPAKLPSGSFAVDAGMVVGDSYAYVAPNGTTTLSAVDPTTLQPLWSTTIPDQNGSGLRLTATSVIDVDIDGAMHIYDRADGHLLWSSPTGVVGVDAGGGRSYQLAVTDGLVAAPQAGSLSLWQQVPAGTTTPGSSAPTPSPAPAAGPGSPAPGAPGAPGAAASTAAAPPPATAVQQTAAAWPPAAIAGAASPPVIPTVNVRIDGPGTVTGGSATHRYLVTLQRRLSDQQIAGRTVAVYVDGLRRALVTSRADGVASFVISFRPGAHRVTAVALPTPTQPRATSRVFTAHARSL